MDNQWEVIDDKGIIYSGTEEEMESMFENIIEDNPEDLEWTGDLRLIEVHNCFR